VKVILFLCLNMMIPSLTEVISGTSLHRWWPWWSVVIDRIDEHVNFSKTENFSAWDWLTWCPTYSCQGCREKFLCLLLFYSSEKSNFAVVFSLYFIPNITLVPISWGMMLCQWDTMLHQWHMKLCQLDMMLCPWYMMLYEWDMMLHQR
jgi:hypothetical protein